MMRLRLAAFAMLAIAACRSLDPEYRTQALRELYPAGTTTREDVQARWRGSGVLLAVERPAEGWEACERPDAGKRALEVAARTGREVAFVEQRIGADGISGGLCYCWFFYDAEQRVVDVAWQWCSD